MVKSPFLKKTLGIVRKDFVERVKGLERGLLSIINDGDDTVCELLKRLIEADRMDVYYLFSDGCGKTPVCGNETLEGFEAILSFLFNCLLDDSSATFKETDQSEVYFPPGAKPRFEMYVAWGNDDEPRLSAKDILALLDLIQEDRKAIDEDEKAVQPMRESGMLGIDIFCLQTRKVVGKISDLEARRKALWDKVKRRHELRESGDWKAAKEII